MKVGLTGIMNGNNQKKPLNYCLRNYRKELFTGSAVPTDHRKGNK